MEEIRIVIVTPEGVIFDKNAPSITLPGADGEFGVHPNHCSLISLLKTGIIEIAAKDQEKEYVAIDWGYARVEHNKVDILANGAIAITENGEISQNLEKAKSLLKKASSDEALISGILSKLDYLRK